MPTYDYICDDCGHEFEAFESIKAEPQTVCPQCRAAALRRKIGAGAAILFKGSGFYQTDYRSESYKQAAKADQEATKGAGGAAGSDTAAGKAGEANGAAGKATAKAAGKSPKSAT